MPAVFLSAKIESGLRQRDAASFADRMASDKRAGTAADLDHIEQRCAGPPADTPLPNAGGRRYEINSLTSDFSSFNSATDASIFVRLKSLIGNPCTISHFPPRTRTGNDEINPFST